MDFRLATDDAATLARYGRPPSTVERILRQIHTAAGTPTQLAAAGVHALVARPSGDADGLVLALLDEFGTEKFCDAVGHCLQRPVTEVAEALNRQLAGHTRDDPLLTGAEAVSLILAREGVTIAFAYVGTSELALCDSLTRSARTHLVNGRGDAECLFLASGASLLGAAAAAILHGARGLSHAAGALADVRRNEVGTVVIVGLPSTASAGFLPPHGEPDLIRTLGVFSKWWYEAGAVPFSQEDRMRQAAQFVATLRDGIRRAYSPPRGPILFAIPQDVAESSWIHLSVLRDRATTPAPPTPTPLSAGALVQEARRRLARSRRPVVLVDDYLVRHDGAKPALADLAHRLAAPVLQVRYRRGAMLFERLHIADVPAFSGWYDPARGDHQAVLAGADLLITIEDRNLYRRVVGPLPACPKLAITSDAAKVRKNQYLRDSDLLVEGDVVATLEVLAKDLAQPLRAETVTWAEEQFDRHTPAATRVSPGTHRLRSDIVGALATALRAAQPSMIVDDSQMFGGLVAESYDLLPPGIRVFGDHCGFVGSGISQAAGLAAANPEARIFCLLGDQGFTNGLQGLVAVVEQNLAVVYLVCNNGGSVSLSIQSAQEHPEWFADGTDPHLRNTAGLAYAAVASSFGIRSSTVDLSQPDDRAAVQAGLENLSVRLQEAVATREPALIELRLPGDGDFWQGIWLSRGYDEFDNPGPKAKPGNIPGC